MSDVQTKPIRRALLIDDEKMDQMLYKLVIDETGLIDELICFTYASDALTHLDASRATPPEVIFLDINMPRMNGFEFLEAATAKFGKAFAKIVVIMITTSLDPRDVERAAKFDVIRDYLNKPLTHEHVRHVVGLLEGRA